MSGLQMNAASFYAGLYMLCLTAMNPVYAGEIRREDAAAVMQQCQAERRRRIVPLRRAEIQQCMEQGVGDRAYCERFHRDFGEVVHTPNGVMPGLFWDLPICERAFQAENYFLLNPRSEVYTY